MNIDKSDKKYRKRISKLKEHLWKTIQIGRTLMENNLNEILEHVVTLLQSYGCMIVRPLLVRPKMYK